MSESASNIEAFSEYKIPQSHGAENPFVARNRHAANHNVMHA